MRGEGAHTVKILHWLARVGVQGCRTDKIGWKGEVATLRSEILAHMPSPRKQRVQETVLLNMLLNFNLLSPL